MVAAVVGVASLAAGAYSANQQSKAAKGAANAQAKASGDANQVQWDIFNQQRSDQQPFRQAGISGLNQYMALLGLPGVSQNGSLDDQKQSYLNANPDVASSGMDAWDHYQKYGQSEGRAWPSNTPAPTGSNPAQTQQDAFAAFRATPGYQFGLDEGTKAVQASAAARGGLNSGATLKALQKFGTNYADQQGFTPYANRLAALAGIGQTATNQAGQYGTNYANQVGNNLTNAGNARAGGIYGSQNAWSNFGQQAVGSLNQYAGSQYNPGGSNATLADGMWGGI